MALGQLHYSPPEEYTGAKFFNDDSKKKEEEKKDKKREKVKKNSLDVYKARRLSVDKSNMLCMHLGRRVQWVVL